LKVRTQQQPYCFDKPRELAKLSFSQSPALEARGLKRVFDENLQYLNQERGALNQSLTRA